MAQATPMANKMKTEGYVPKLVNPSDWPDRGAAGIFDTVVDACIESTEEDFAHWLKVGAFEGADDEQNTRFKALRVFMQNFPTMPLEERAAWVLKRLGFQLNWRTFPREEFLKRLAKTPLAEIREFDPIYFVKRVGKHVYIHDVERQADRIVWYFVTFREYFEAKLGHKDCVRFYDLLGDWEYESATYRELTRKISESDSFIRSEVEGDEGETSGGKKYRVLRVPVEVAEVSDKLDKLLGVETNMLAILRRYKMNEDVIGLVVFRFFEAAFEVSTKSVSNPKVQSLLRAWRGVEAENKQGPRGGYRGGEQFTDSPGDESPGAVGARIRHLRLQRGMTGVQLAASVGIKTPQAISAWENGHTMPPDERLELCAKTLDTTVEFLKTGVKEELGKADAAAEIGYKMLNGDTNLKSALLESGILEKLNQAGAIDYAEVPLFTASVSAGSGEIVFEETAEQPLWFRKSFFEKRGLLAKDCRCFHVHGDSMEPYLADGDVVLTGGKPEHIKDGMLYVLRYGTDLRVKRLRPTHTGGLILMSDNPRYPEEEISASDAEKYITVLGQVHWRGG